MADVHVVPVNDLKDHVETIHCWCAPRLEWAEPGWVVVHHAADRREWTEPKPEPLVVQRRPH